MLQGSHGGRDGSHVDASVATTVHAVHQPSVHTCTMPDVHLTAVAPPSEPGSRVNEEHHTACKGNTLSAPCTNGGPSSVQPDGTADALHADHNGGLSGDKQHGMMGSKPLNGAVSGMVDASEHKPVPDGRADGAISGAAVETQHASSGAMCLAPPEVNAEATADSAAAPRAMPGCPNDRPQQATAGDGQAACGQPGGGTKDLDQDRDVAAMATAVEAGKATGADGTSNPTDAKPACGTVHQGVDSAPEDGRDAGVGQASLPGGEARAEAADTTVVAAGAAASGEGLGGATGVQISGNGAATALGSQGKGRLQKGARGLKPGPAGPQGPTPTGPTPTVNSASVDAPSASAATGPAASLAAAPVVAASAAAVAAPARPRAPAVGDISRTYRQGKADEVPWPQLFTQSGQEWPHKMVWGAACGRTFLYSGKGEDPEQVTKSCHFCQNQHVYVQCGATPTCNKSYCRKCVEAHMPSLTYEQAWQACPSCRSCCNCKVCMRKVRGRFIHSNEFSCSRGDALGPGAALRLWGQLLHT